VLFKLVQDYLANGQSGNTGSSGSASLLVMMILFGRVYGAVMAALIFAVCTAAKLPFMQSIVFLPSRWSRRSHRAGRIFCDGRLQSPRRAVAVQAGLKARFTRKGSDHAPVLETKGLHQAGSADHRDERCVADRREGARATR
jgi:hypothetical protein